MWKFSFIFLCMKSQLITISSHKSYYINFLMYVGKRENSDNFDSRGEKKGSINLCEIRVHFMWELNKTQAKGFQNLIKIFHSKFYNWKEIYTSFRYIRNESYICHFFLLLIKWWVKSLIHYTLTHNFHLQCNLSYKILSKIHLKLLQKCQFINYS